jgi:threonine/homoserine/homoserine lactone efflux protein
MSIDSPELAAAIPRAPSTFGPGRFFLLSFITAFSGAVMPGPVLVATIQQTAIQGFKAVIGLMTGHALLELVCVALLVLGLQAVLARPRVRGCIGLIGGVALVYMGVDMIRSAWGLSLSLSAQTGVHYSWGELILLGALLSAANPYFTGWWATVGAGQLAHTAPRTALEYLSFYVGHEAADFTWYLFVGLLIITGRQWLTDGIYRGLIIGCACVLLMIAVWFLAAGARLTFTRQRSNG